MSQEQTLYTTKEAAKLLNISHRTLDQFRCKGGGPKFIKFGNRCVRYSYGDLTNWIKDKTMCSTSEAAMARDAS